MNEQLSPPLRTEKALAARKIYGTKAERDLKKTLTVLRWISTFGYSKTAILCRRLGIKNRAFLSQLVNQGLIQLKQYPKVITVVLLTLKGKQFLERHSGISMRLCKRPNLNDVKHDIMVQWITCKLIKKAEEDHLTSWFFGPKGITKKVQPRDKRTDAEVIYLKNGNLLKIICVEVELNKKTGSRGFEFWQRIMKRIESDSRVEFRIYSDKKSILDFYRNELAKMREFGMKWFTQNEFSNQWFPSSRRMHVDMTFVEKISFHLEPSEKPPKKNNPRDKKVASSLKKKSSL